MMNNNPDIYGKETKKFFERYSIPILANVITHMNAFRIVDISAMNAPIGYVNGKVVETMPNFILSYVPIVQDWGRGELASVYDLNTLSNLICNRLDAIILNKLKIALFNDSVPVNRSDVLDIDPGTYNTAIISHGIKNWAYEKNGKKSIANDQSQALCSSDYINNGKTELLIDNSAAYEYVILGNVGNGGATYCPYMPVFPSVKVVDDMIKIIVSSRHGMEFNGIGKHYKMYRIVD